MANGLNIDGVDWDLKAFLQNEQLSDEIKKLFINVIKDAAALVVIIKDPKANFKFSDYPAIRNKVKKLFRQFANNQQIYINKATQSLWELANKKNDTLIESIADKWDKPLKQFSGYGDANIQALRAFQQRVENGLGLSDRIWNNTRQAQAEIEALISKQLQAGAPAINTAKLVRDFTLANGGDFLSPGRGVYKSSLKNAQRLIRTENNMAYRAADFERWQSMDFVIGVEVRLSNNPNHCPMCAALAGKYPKDFKFLGWHPNCRCYVVPILMKESDFDRLEQMQLAGEDTSTFIDGKQYKKIPIGFSEWIEKNKNNPLTNKLYFVRDNFKNGDVLKGLRFEVTPEKPKRNKRGKSKIPENIADYESEMGVVIDKSLFDLLNTPVALNITNSGSAYFNPSTDEVTISLIQRRKNSKWYAEGIFYHEYGHAVDWQTGLKDNDDLKGLMKKYRKTFSKNSNELYKDLSKQSKLDLKEAIENSDYNGIEKIGAFRDTLMSLNKQFGEGHTRKYFSTKGMSEAEFIAHSFENKYIGNEYFKEVAPDLYEEMIDFIKSLSISE